MFSRLRHPVRAIRGSFGTPGLIVAVIALIAALGGTAIASGGLSGAEKKLIKKEAEKQAKKFAVAGPQGAPGAPGPKGAPGEKGTKGDNGTNGTNGTNGSPWTAGGTLPSGATETGSIAGDSLSSETPAVVRTDVPISFSIPLAEGLDDEHVLVIYENAAVPSACENPGHPDPASAVNPEASSGYLCVYLASDTSESTTHTVHVASATTDEGASTAGAVLVLIGGEAGWPFQGTWAVTG